MKILGDFFDKAGKIKEIEEINQTLSSPEIWQDQKRSQSLQQEKKILERDLQFISGIAEKKEEV